MIGGEGALVLGGFRRRGDRHADHRAVAAGARSCLIMALAGMLAGGLWIGLVGALRHYRGVNETISSLLLTYIAIAIMNFFVEGALRDPGHAQQALDHADRRRLHGRHDSRHRCALGPCRRASCSPCVLLRPDDPHHLRLRRPHHRRQCARRAGAGPAGRQADRRPAARSPAPAPALPAISRSPRSRAAPMPRSPPATASPASSSRSSRGIIRWRSSRSPSCSAASPRRAA